MRLAVLVPAIHCESGAAPCIEKRQYDVLTERVSLSTAEKLATIAKLWADAALIRPK